MRFTTDQYDQAIQALRDAKEQLQPDGRHCAVCGDDGHQAFECGHNPLLAMAMCQQIATQSGDLHETLHFLAGYNQAFGVQLGPRRIVVPDPAPVTLTDAGSHEEV